MIGVFADPYPDELFYSICARTCKRAGYAGHCIALLDLFGRETITTSVVFPSYLDDLVARLPPESAYTSDYFITEHTLLPFYQPFLPPERSSHLRLDMCGRKGPSLHTLSGMTGSPIPLPGWLRFCPQCVGEDKSRYGECYWHRIHQISGVEICPVHEVYLQQSPARARYKKSRQEFVSAEDAIQWTEQHQSHAPSPYHPVLLALARDADFLLRQYRLPQEPAGLSHRYRQLLSQVGLATYRGRVDKSLFLQQFRNCYPLQLLQLLHCEREETWLLRLVRAGKNAQDPLHHLLLIHLLGYTAEDFFGLSIENKPFGDGPWPCLNPVCPESQQSCIRECRIVSGENRKPVGTFVCTCGFAYSRTSPDNPFQLNKIKAFGTLWETRLQILWGDETASLRAIARQLGVDPLAVKRQAVRMGLLFPRPVGRKDRDFSSDFDDHSCPQNGETSSSAIPAYLQLKGPKRSGQTIEQARDPATLETSRATWLTLIQAHPGAGVDLLRSKEPSLYRWLCRNDKMWLSAHPPLCRKPNPPSSRVDWQARDLQLADHVRVAALRLKDLPGPPVRINISSLGRETGHLTLLQQRLDRLPRTADALRECIETREAFAVRRVWGAMLAFRQVHIYPKRWQLIESAGVGQLVTQPEVKSALDTALQILRSEWNV
jgi:hypothetical protein